MLLRWSTYASQSGHRLLRLLDLKGLVFPHFGQVNTNLSLFHMVEWQNGQYLGRQSPLCSHSQLHLRQRLKITSLSHLVDLHSGHLNGFLLLPFQVWPQRKQWLIFIVVSPHPYRVWMYVPKIYNAVYNVDVHTYYRIRVNYQICGRRTDHVTSARS